MSSPTLRPFQESDIPAAAALWRATEGLGDGPGDDPAGVARFLRRNPGLSLVAEAEGELVGAILCGHDGRRGFIYRAAVAKSMRRQGLARAMAERCLEGLRAEGIPRCMLFVLAENDAAMRFWKSLGARERAEMKLLSIDARRADGAPREIRP
jgi:ribosomal protein S18 acetylase RimI-like enzyme